MRRSTLLGLLLVTGAAVAPNAARAQDVEATPQRPSFTTNTSITSSGTIELEAGVEATGAEQSFVNLIKYTPSRSRLAGRVEFGIEFDALTRDGSGVGFGDQVRVQARIPTARRGPLSFAVMPFAAVPTRSGAGPGGLGGTFITTIDAGAYSSDVNVSLLKATGATPRDRTSGNLTLALSRGLGGRDGKLSLYTSGLADFGQGRAPRYSLQEGVTYEVASRVVLDVSVGQFEIGSGAAVAVVAGATINFGHLRELFDIAGFSATATREAATREPSTGAGVNPGARVRSR